MEKAPTPAPPLPTAAASTADLQVPEKVQTKVLVNMEGTRKLEGQEQLKYANGTAMDQTIIGTVVHLKVTIQGDPGKALVVESWQPEGVIGDSNTPVSIAVPEWATNIVAHHCGLPEAVP